MREDDQRARGREKIPPARRQEIARSGAAALHAAGKAHRFTSEEARAAGKKGGRAKAKRMKETNPE